MRRLGGRFVLGEKIGSGGMSEVYRGTDEVLDRPVAIKVLRGGFEGSDVGSRFSREGRTAARLSHPNVVQVYDAGEDDLDGREVHYIVMEHVPGGDLKGLMDERGPLGEGEAARIGAEVAAGLIHAHERGIVHRDIKPHNILLDEYGHPKLTDFGIAKALDASHATQTGHYLGTALYSSPEQLRGETATPASDVYALGATLYHAVLGEPPFSGGPIEVASQQISRPPTPPRARGAGVGSWMDALIMRCLLKDPDLRPGTHDLQAELLSISAAEVTGAPAEAPRAGGGDLRAAGAAAAAGIVRAARAVGGRGAAGVGAAARGLTADPDRTVTLPTRTFRPGRDRSTRAGIAVGAAALLVAVLLVWGISSLFSGGDATQGSGGVQNVSGAGGEAPPAPERGTTGEERSEDENRGERTDQEPSAPPADPAAAEDAVYEMYVAAATNDFERSYGFLSRRLQQEVGSVGEWEDRYDDVSYLSFSSGPSGSTSGGETRVEFTAQETRPGGQRTVDGAWVVVEEDGQARLDRFVAGNG